MTRPFVLSSVLIGRADDMGLVTIRAATLAAGIDSGAQLSTATKSYVTRLAPDTPGPLDSFLRFATW